uniref:Uncharacterized protein n=1 Tax=Arion vulgaris TaxID=1028688 RepID=A0A0B7A6N9_9EUPU
MTSLHKVTRDELPILLEWTAKYLPLSYKHYETIQAKIQGIWQGTPLYTLGWPDIRAVGEGPADSSECQCADYFNKFQATSVFSPNSEDLEELLTTPGFLDWTKPIIFYAICHDNGDVVEKVSNATGTKYNTRYVNHAFLANPGDVVERTIPDGFHIRSLDPDLHSDYVASTWPHHRLHTNQYIAEVLKSFPSVGVFDRYV